MKYLIVFIIATWAASAQGITPNNVNPNAKQGNGNKFQLSVGSFIPGDCLVFDANGNSTPANCAGTGGGLTSVGLTMPTAFAVTNSPLISNGTIAVAGAGTATQYINGLGQLASLSATAPLLFNPSTGVFSCGTCTTSFSALTNNAVLIGNGGLIMSPIPVDTTTTHALFATATAPAFRAITPTDIPVLNQSTTGNAATATALAAVPTQCTGVMFATGITANGNANCGTPAGGGGGAVGAVNHVQTSNGSGAFLDGGCTMVSTVLTCGTSLILSGAASALTTVTVPTFRVDSITGNMELTRPGNSTADFVGVVPLPSRGAQQFLTFIDDFGNQNSTSIQEHDLPPVPVLISTGSTSDPDTLAVSYYLFNNSTGAISFGLPPGFAGAQRCYRQSTSRTGVITITLTTGNQIDLNGANGTVTTGTLVSGGALGDAVCLVSDAANHWMAYVQHGTWVNN